MAKQMVMKYNQIVMGILSINPYSFATPALNWLRALSPFLIITTLVIFIALATLYACQQTQISLVLEAIAPTLGGTAALGGYLNMRWNLNSVGEMNSRLQETVDHGRIVA